MPTPPWESIPARLLIIANEMPTAVDLKQRIEGLGYEVMAAVATCGERAARMGPERPDLVLAEEGDSSGINEFCLEGDRSALEAMEQEVEAAVGEAVRRAVASVAEVPA